MSDRMSCLVQLVPSLLGLWGCISEDKGDVLFCCGQVWILEKEPQQVFSFLDSCFSVMCVRADYFIHSVWACWVFLTSNRRENRSDEDTLWVTGYFGMFWWQQKSDVHASLQAYYFLEFRIASRWTAILVPFEEWSALFIEYCCTAEKQHISELASANVASP